MGLRLGVRGGGCYRLTLFTAVGKEKVGYHYLNVVQMDKGRGKGVNIL